MIGPPGAVWVAVIWGCVPDNFARFAAKITVVLCVILSLFHVYTAGFGLLNEVVHRTVHLSFVLGLVLKALAQVGVRRLAVQTLEWTDTGAPRP